MKQPIASNKIETIDEFLARGGTIKRCPTAFARDGHSPQVNCLSTKNSLAITNYYHALEIKYQNKYRKKRAALEYGRLFHYYGPSDLNGSGQAHNIFIGERHSIGNAKEENYGTYR